MIKINFWDFLLALSESGLGGVILTILIMIFVLAFALSCISIPFRIGKIKNDIEAIKNLLSENMKDNRKK